MKYPELYKKMLECRMISDDWRNMLELLAEEIGYSVSGDETAVENRVMELLTLYCALMDDGNVFMSLDKDILKAKVGDKISKLRIQFQEDEEAAGESLGQIELEMEQAYAALPEIERLPVIGNDKFFIIEDGILYTRKHFNAVKSISASVRRLFKSNTKVDSEFSYKNYVCEDYKLAENQEEVLGKGYYNNLLITGGPGTGKTTSIFFLLLSLFMGKPCSEDIYLTAPSGKAASRMTDSIKQCASSITDNSIACTVDMIQKLNGSTIHSLLGFDRSTGGFVHTQRNPFPENSTFVIDEASMIDVCLFASLLEAIPDSARVFILGDKNQLPSVECGAVFGNLLKILDADNIVTLTESKRFSEDTKIYALAKAINDGNALPATEDEWRDPQTFSVKELKDLGTTDAQKKLEIFYFSDQTSNNADMISSVTENWYSYFYKDLQSLCTDLDSDNAVLFRQIFEKSENARILCANNRGTRGVESINKALIKKYFKSADCVSGFYPGELLMITRNIKQLNLNNGECGVAVKFKDDDMLYVMFNKSVTISADEGKLHSDKIFKIGDYVFYPVSKIDREDISSAFAITIHKSQGSDYGNILVILPRLKGHPLLNRQLLYTAITRTKGDTFILSNQENMECARDTEIVRDTGIDGFEELSN